MLKRMAVLSMSLAFTANALLAQDKPAVVANVKVVSSKVKDVSSLEAWKKSYIKEGMTDKDKALAIWETIVSHQHQDSPPSEFLNNEGLVQDALKMMNVYGYSFCGVAANEMASLARYAGLKARIRTIRDHVVPELFYDDAWHLLDASLINYFPKEDGSLASIDEIAAAVKEWYAANPDYLIQPKDPKGKPKGDDGKLQKLWAQDGWSAWKQGPKLLAASPMYDAQGWLAAKTHGWSSTMCEYDGSTLFDYEAGYSMGYKVNIQLRPGEKLTRNWSNKGLFVNMDDKTAGKPAAISGVIGKGNFAYCARFGDIAPGRVGNGMLEYMVPLNDGTLPRNAWRYENLASNDGADGKPLLAVADASKQGILEIRMPTSYVYLTGKVDLSAVLQQGGSIGVYLSDTNGASWKEVQKIEKAGPASIDLGSLVIRKYDYILRLVIDGKGTGISGLSFAHDVQHSQRALPALAKGDNTIEFSTGPQEGTITIEGSFSPELAKKHGQVTYLDYGPVVNNLAQNLAMVDMAKGGGDITYDIATPGDMTRMNILLHYRARSEKGGWDVQVSFDGGKTFNTVEKCAGPTAATGRYLVIDKVPAGTKAAKVRFVGTAANNAALIFNLRIDADYKLPNSGVRPVKVTYVWEEGGVAKTREFVSKKDNETFGIKCESDPKMKSIVLELAD